MRTSNRGLDLIKQHEGFESKAYTCPAGKLTIGYGHVILPHEHNLTTAELTEAEATEILRDDVAIAESAVNNLVKVEIDQNQFDALVSFTFNLGSGSLANSTLLRLLNNDDHNGAAGQFERWVYATVDGKKQKLGGLVRRRADERDLFLEPYLKPLAVSRTVWGSAVAILGTSALEISQWVASTVPTLERLATSDVMKGALFLMSLGGAALALYARIDDRNKASR